MDLSTAQTILSNWETAAVNLSSAAASIASGSKAQTISVTTPGGSWSVTQENIIDLRQTIRKEINYWKRVVNTLSNTNKRSVKQITFAPKNR